MPRHSSNLVLTGNYSVGSEIGKGSFAIVYKGTHTASRSTVAIKAVQYAKLSKKLLSSLESEIAILKPMHHPHVVALIDYQQTSTHFFLVMEYCSLGDLSFFFRKRQDISNSLPLISSMFQRYPSPPGGGLNEHLARHFLKQLASAVEFLRERHLVHRDIKPQNLLLCPPAKSQQDAINAGYKGLWELPVLKLADFGFARILPNASLAETLCGSPLYMAPEILRHEKYNAKADLWSVGTVFHEMLTGRPPFSASNHIELLQVIEKSNDVVKFPPSSTVSKDSRYLIRALLKKNPIERMGFGEFFDDPVIKEDLTTENRPLDQSFLDEALYISDYLQLGGTGISKRSKKPNLEIIAPTHSIIHEESITQKTNSPPFSSWVGDNSQKSKGALDSSYVIVEKRTVEINSLADKFTKPATMKRPTRPKSLPMERRYSISYGSSPTNALTRAINMASERLFGTVSPVTPIGIERPLPTILAPETSVIDEQSLVKSLEDFSSMAKVLSVFAQVKYSQIMPSKDSIDPLSPEIFAVVSQEAIVLYVKCLSILSQGMNSARKWIEANDNKSPGSQLVEQVQWIREKFNEVLDCAEYTQLLKSEYAYTVNEDKVRHITCEKLVFDRATELSKQAAQCEKEGQDLETCHLYYDTSIWMLRAILENDEDESTSDPAKTTLTLEDNEIVCQLLQSLERRLAVVERKISQHHSNVTTVVPEKGHPVTLCRSGTLIRSTKSILAPTLEESVEIP